MSFSDEVQKGLIAGAFGLVGTLIPALLSWSHDRSAASARMQTLDEAAKRLDFWEQWLKLSTQVAEPTVPADTLKLQQELALLSDILQRDSFLAHAQITKQRGKSTEFQTKLDALPIWRRLLLLYLPARSAAWFPRLFFFAGLGLALLVPFGLLATPDPLTLKDFAISEFCLFIWMFVFRSLSRGLEEPRSAGTVNHTTTTEPVPKVI